MSLDPVPPPFPHGNSAPTTKHQCSLDTPCTVLLSEVGKCFHAFPKGKFYLRYSPPSIPLAVLRHFHAHPFTWSWMICSGPNVGKTMLVPTIPIACPKGSAKAICWVVALFHSFKAHLQSRALNRLLNGPPSDNLSLPEQHVGALSCPTLLPQTSNSSCWTPH